MNKKLHTLLSIAGSDSMGGAGIQADLRSGISLGVHVLTAITAVTVQNSKGIRDLGLVSPKILEKQLEAIFEEINPDAVKIGLIGSLDAAEIITDFLLKLPEKTSVIVDPVYGGSADAKLLYSPEEYKKIYLDILNLPNVILTPNCKELNILFNINIEEAFDYMDLTGLLKKIETEYLVITGVPFREDFLTDILISEQEIVKINHKRIDCCNLHGTGCCFSSLLASNLALGKKVKEAFELSVNEMGHIIANSTKYTLGESSYGPLNINEYKI